MRKLILLFAFALPALAQIPFNRVRIIPTPTGTIGEVDFYGTNGNYTGLKSTASPAANLVWSLPPADAAAGSPVCTDGSAHLTLTGCTGGSLAPPVTISASISSPILTLTNSGAGDGLDIGVSAGYAIKVTSGDIFDYNNLRLGNITGSTQWLLKPTYVASTTNLFDIISSASKTMLRVDAQNGAVSIGLTGGGNSVDGVIWGNLTDNGNTNVTGNFSASGTISGAHLQNLGSSDGPTFSSVGTGSLLVTGGGLYVSPQTMSQSSGSSPTLTIANSAGFHALTVSSGLSVFNITDSSTAVTIVNSGAGAALAVAGTTQLLGTTNMTGTIQANSTSGVSGSTCTQWTLGICTHL